MQVGALVEILETSESFIVLWLSPSKEGGWWINSEEKTGLPSWFDCFLVEKAVEAGKYEISLYESEKFFIPEAHIKGTARNHRDEVWNMLSSALLCEPEIYEKKARAKLLNDIALKNGKGVKNLYRYLHSYWQSGKSINAFLPNWVRGVSSGGAKRGPKPMDGVRGKQLDDSDYEKFEKAVKAYYLQRHSKSMRYVYRKMLTDHYSNEADDADDLEFNNDDECPSYSQFCYWVNNRVEPSEKALAQQGQREFNLNKRAITSRSDLEIIGPGSQYQVDSTIADIYLVSETKRSDQIGRPDLHASIDAFSRMCTGVAIGITGPAWEDSGELVINIMEDKVEFCGKYGIIISPEDWPCQHMPASLLGDRGEMICKNSTVLAAILGTHLRNAPPFRADYKGMIERFFRSINESAVAHLPGAILGDMKKRGSEDYRELACLTLRELTQAVIYFTLCYNKWHVMDYYVRDEDMIADGVRPIPLDLWNWGVANCSGSLRVMNIEKVKWAVLPGGQAKVTPEGVRFKNLFYSGEAAVSEHWFENARSGGNWSVSISYDPGDCSSIAVWGPDFKTYEELQLLEWEAKYIGKSFSEVAASKQSEAGELKKLKAQEDLEVAKMYMRQEQMSSEAQKKTDEAREKVDQSKTASVSNIKINRANEAAAIKAAEKAVGSTQGHPSAAAPSPTESTQLTNTSLPVENPKHSEDSAASAAPEPSKASANAGKAEKTVPIAEKKVGTPEWLLDLRDSADSSNAKVIIDNLLGNGELWA
jgi:hypothetical protein